MDSAYAPYTSPPFCQICHPLSNAGNIVAHKKFPFMDGTNPLNYKVVLLGNTGTGKTTILLSKLFDDGGRQKHGPTIGVNCQDLHIALDHQDVTLNVWDTAGQEVYHSIVPIYLRNADAALLVYDISDTKSFDRLDAWKSMLEEQQCTNIPLFVVGNKIDLEELQKVEDRAAEEYAKAIGATFHRVSALNGTGIERLFEDVAVQVVQSERRSLDERLIEAPEAPQGGCKC